MTMVETGILYWILMFFNMTVLMFCSLACPYPANRHGVRYADVRFPDA
jgi:hypothetical protein